MNLRQSCIEAAEEAYADAFYAVLKEVPDDKTIKQIRLMAQEAAFDAVLDTLDQYGYEWFDGADRAGGYSGTPFAHELVSALRADQKASYLR